MALTPELQEQLEREFAANRAWQAALTRKQRLEAGEVELELVPSPEDAPIYDDVIQTELSAFGKSLRVGDVRHFQMAIAMDAIDAHGYPLAEFIIQNLVTPAIGIITAAVGGWFAGRSGRKARIKIGDIEAEARTPEEVENLLKRAIALLEAYDKTKPK